MKWQQSWGHLDQMTVSSTYLLGHACRMLENFEKQCALSAEVQSGVKRSQQETKRPLSGYRPNDYRPRDRDITKPPREMFDNPRGQIKCYLCNELGHVRRDCPLKTESPGRSKSSTAAVEANDMLLINLHSLTYGEDLSESQLESLLAEKRRRREETELPGDRTQASVITASEEKADLVGPVVTMDVNIKGIPISAMIDTGAQSTIIISRYTLHAVIQHLKSTGQEVPHLETPMVRLYGKESDGQRGDGPSGIRSERE